MFLTYLKKEFFLRNQHNRPEVFNRERGFYEANESTVKKIIRTNWWTAEKIVC